MFTADKAAKMLLKSPRGGGRGGGEERTPMYKCHKGVCPNVLGVKICPLELLRVLNSKMATVRIIGTF